MKNEIQKENANIKKKMQKIKSKKLIIKLEI